MSSKPARSYANGTLVFAPDFSSDAFLQSFVSTQNVKYADQALRPAQDGQPGVVVVELASPYIMTRAKGEALGADGVAISKDGGKTFQAINLKDFSEAVKGQVAVQVQLTFKEALKSLRLETIVQNNSGSLPYLSPGKNTVTMSVADPKSLGQNLLVITYAYRPGYRNKSFEQLFDEDNEVAKGHSAVWQDSAICVQKTFSAGDLPAQFEIDCPTPKGKYPVYPRMLFVRREVLSPGQKPAATPTPPATPVVGPNEELATLPLPWTIGFKPRPPCPCARRRPPFSHRRRSRTCPKRARSSSTSSSSG